MCYFAYSYGFTSSSVYNTNQQMVQFHEHYFIFQLNRSEECISSSKFVLFFYGASMVSSTYRSKLKPLFNCIIQKALT